MKRVVLDQGLAPRAAALLRSQGWDAIHVSEAGMERADDYEILSFARRRGLVCVTLDHDFHAHLALAQSGSPTVIFVRLEGLSAEQQAELIVGVWEKCKEAISEGAAISVDGATVRYRKLPLR